MAQNGMSKEEYKKVVSMLLEKRKDGKEKGVKPHWTPEVALIVADAKFRRNKGNDYKRGLLKKTKYFAYVDTRKSEAAVFADILLPADTMRYGISAQVQ